MEALSPPAAAPALVLALLLPALLALGVMAAPSRRAALRLAPWAAAPAVLLALAAPSGLVVELPWLLLGTRLGLDETGRPFLLLTGLVWLIAGLYADEYLRGESRRHVFAAFFLATLAGNLGVCLALDAVSFYSAFALMSLAAYGLVVHERSGEARRAGRVYIVMVVLGEGLLVAALLIAVGSSGTHLLPELVKALTAEQRTAASVLFAAGFAIKTGVLFLHLWLPLAHPVAPVPASAVLSGAILKAGLLGWLRFLPLGEAALRELGVAMLAAGFAGAFYGVAIGLAQRDPKVLLAYSSVSQMGLMTAGVGAGLMAPAAWPLLLPVVSLYAVHHAFSKSALFLGIGVVRAHGGRGAALAGMALPAAALAGVPWSAGAFAKDELKTALHALPAPWPALLDVALPLSAVATALLMIRLLWLLWGTGPTKDWRPLAQRWSLSIVAVVALGGWTAWSGDVDAEKLKAAAWPVLAAAGIAGVAWGRRWRAPYLPAGDVLVVVERGLTVLRRAMAVVWGEPAAPRHPRGGPVRAGRRRGWKRFEIALGGWPVGGGLWLLLLLCLMAALARGGA